MRDQQSIPREAWDDLLVGACLSSDVAYAAAANRLNDGAPQFGSRHDRPTRYDVRNAVGRFVDKAAGLAPEQRFSVARRLALIVEAGSSEVVCGRVGERRGRQFILNLLVTGEFLARYAAAIAATLADPFFEARIRTSLDKLFSAKPRPKRTAPALELT